MTLQTFDSHEGNPTLRLQAAALLARYPALDAFETMELLDFYNSAPAIDTALLTCDEDLRPKIASFLSDNHKRLRHQSPAGVLIWMCLFFLASIIGAI